VAGILPDEERLTTLFDGEARLAADVFGGAPPEIAALATGLGELAMAIEALSVESRRSRSQ